MSGAPVDVGALPDFPERSIRIVEVDGVDVGVARWDGEEVHALRNVCPHEGGPVCLGRVSPRIVAENGRPGTLALAEEMPVLSCPWHGWEFDLRTGLAVWGKPGYRVRRYAAQVVDGRVVVTLEEDRARADRLQLELDRGGVTS